MTAHKQMQLGRFFIGLTVDTTNPKFPLGIQVGFDEVAFSLRTTAVEFTKVANSLDRQLANDLGLRQIVEIADNRGLIKGLIDMTRLEASTLVRIMRALVQKYEAEVTSGKTKQ